MSFPQIFLRYVTRGYDNTCQFNGMKHQINDMERENGTTKREIPTHKKEEWWWRDCLWVSKGPNAETIDRVEVSFYTGGVKVILQWSLRLRKPVWWSRSALYIEGVEVWIIKARSKTILVFNTASVRRIVMDEVKNCTSRWCWIAIFTRV